MLAVVFVLLLFLGFIKNDPASQLDRLSAYLKETKTEKEELNNDEISN